MPSGSAEALLLSALLNTQAVGEESQYAISPADFTGYSDEYTWLGNYVVSYGCQPTWEIFKLKFPDFPACGHTDVRSAANAVHESANRRRITTAMADATDHLHMGDATAAYQTLVSATPRSAAAKPRDILLDTDHLYEFGKKPYCIEVPYPTLQRYTGGIRAGNLWYLAGRPGQGKSAHLSSIAKQAVLTGNRVLFYSLEMSEEEVRARFHAALAIEMGYRKLTLTNLLDHRVDLDEYRLFLGELKDRLLTGEGHLDVHTPADGPVSPATVAAHCGDYDLVIIDYITLMAADGGGRAIDDWRVLASISNSLKSTALAQKAGILCAAQINRDGETGSAPPKVKNLAQSDSLGQDGDVVLTMRSKPKNVATAFSLEKNRHGPSGIPFYTTFDPNTGTYTEISGDHAEDLVINAEALADNPNPPKLRVIQSEDER
jgi:replicative DNA helicase